MVEDPASVEDQEMKPPEEADGKSKRTRERSSISFPYNTLDDAVEVVQAIHQIGGSSAKLEQIVKPLKHDNISSGAFRLKLSATRMFGLIELEGQLATLTNLGRRVIQQDTAKDARAEAFLNVPLYRAVYDQYSGYTLPHDVGLESEMETLGVAKKTKGRARQVFQRSAHQAGFFPHGKDRLVSPIGTPTTKPIVEPPTGDGETPESKNGGGGGGNTDGGYYKHPLMNEYLKTMPSLRSDWEESALDEWLETFKRIVRVIRPTTEQ